MQRGVEALQHALEEKAADGFRWQVVKMPREDHESIVLRSVYAGLEMIFDEWRLPRQRTDAFGGDVRGQQSPAAHVPPPSGRGGRSVAEPSRCGIMHLMRAFSRFLVTLVFAIVAGVISRRAL